MFQSLLSAVHQREACKGEILAECAQTCEIGVADASRVLDFDRHEFSRRLHDEIDFSAPSCAPKRDLELWRDRPSPPLPGAQVLPNKTFEGRSDRKMPASKK